ncbi:HDOD domain-containing protein [Neptuniibacter sp. QD37_11]|uniref:HDOD domain-containing protein n=1 Tax=Neptuniibacter sp. QD37_11 TaxID=3398209 RepID=UPI0039F5FC9D
MSTLMRERLESKGIEYKVYPCRQDLSACVGFSSKRLVSAYLNVGGRKVQLIFPASSMLDIKRCSSIYGESVKLMPRERVESQISERLGTSVLPDFILRLGGFETVVDQAVSSMSRIDILQEDGSMLRISGAELWDSLPDESRGGELTIPVANYMESVLAKDSLLKHKARDQVDSCTEFPAFPSTAMQIVRLRMDIDAGVTELSDLLRSDGPLSAQIVGWASSSYYAANGGVAGIEDAISRVLGFDQVINLSMHLAIHKQFNFEDNEVLSKYWRESIMTAIVAEMVAKKIDMPEGATAGLCYLLGLLHNFGDLLVAECFENEYHRIEELVLENPHLPRGIIQAAIMHTTRGQVGSWLCRNWSLPEVICQGIALVDTPEQEGSDPAAVHMSKVVRLAKAILFNLDMSKEAPEKDDKLNVSLGVQPVNIMEIKEAIRKKAPEIEELTKLA